jgi:hypothetical protein
VVEESKDASAGKESGKKIAKQDVTNQENKE